MFKFSFLVNPISGGGQGKVILNFVPEIMQSMGFEDSEWTAELTNGKRLREQIRETAEKTETLIAVGGDGTMSTMLSVMLESGLADKVRIGLIPLGTPTWLAIVCLCGVVGLSSNGIYDIPFIKSIIDKLLPKKTKE